MKLSTGAKLTKGFSRLSCSFGLSPFNSFTAGTPVETEEGQKPIEEVKVGDKVLAENPETGEQGYFEVVALTNHPTDEVLRVTIEAEAKAEAEKETSVLDTSTESGDNDQAQLNSGADDEHRPTFQPSNLPTFQPSNSPPTTPFTSKGRAGCGPRTLRQAQDKSGRWGSAAPVGWGLG